MILKSLRYCRDKGDRNEWRIETNPANGESDLGRLNPINFSDRFPGLPQIQNTHLPG